MSSYVIPLFPAAASSPLPTRDAVAAELSRLRDRVDAGLPGKADKVPSASAGNLASLDASGNLADSGATPASIKAAAVAEVVANAPGTMDTLKEIADILGSTQQTGTVLKRILDLESGKADSSSLAAVATSGSYADLSGKPAIPAAVTVDAALATRGAAADAKAVGDALRSGFTEWEFSGSGIVQGSVYTITLGQMATLNQDGEAIDEEMISDSSVLEIVFHAVQITATRHLITPTKTSQLTNDSGFLTSHQDISGKADKDTGATAGNLAALNAQGNLADSGAKVSDFAAKADLPYRLVEPGEWEFSEPQGLTNFTVTLIEYDNGHWTLYYTSDETTSDTAGATGSETDLTVTFRVGIDQEYTVTATRASLPGHLCDRAINAVTVSSPLASLTVAFPPATNGKARDFILALTCGATPPNVTFPAGVTIVIDDSTDLTAEEGLNLYSFTEISANTFVASHLLVAAYTAQ